MTGPVNPFGLDLGALLVLSWMLHVIGDFLLQNEWMAVHKTLRRERPIRRGDGMMTPPRFYQPTAPWWDRHPAAYAHAAIHAGLLAPVLGASAVLVGVLHLVIDTRAPVRWWMRRYRQTLPDDRRVLVEPHAGAARPDRAGAIGPYFPVPAAQFSIGTWVMLEVDQAMHVLVLVVACIVTAALS
jgi:hypothetical protein